MSDEAVSQEEFDMPVAVTMNDQLRQEVLDTFRKADKDRNGTLDKKEFIAALGPVLPGKSAKYIFAAIDVDNSGSISTDEFENFLKICLKVKQTGIFDEFLALLFRACDKKHKGYLTTNEFGRFCKMMSAKINFFTKKKMFKSFDMDGDGRLELCEIQQMYRNIMGSPLGHQIADHHGIARPQ